MQSTTHDESVLSLRWRYTAGEYGQWYTPADGMSIAPTRHADSAGASSRSSPTPFSSAIESIRQGSSCPDEAAVVLVVAAMASMIRPEQTALHSMVSGTSSAPTGSQPRGRPRPAYSGTGSEAQALRRA
jgi:hypothetical protein